ncbi:MAG: ribonuclease III [Cyanobacteriota bacterium]
MSLPPLRSESLRDLALTHRSRSAESNAGVNNERLEFLGDAVLGFTVADLLYRRFPQSSEAELTRLRSQLVEQSQLARWAEALALGARLRLGKGAENNGARRSPSVLSDALEAWIGALFWEQGLESAYAFIERLVNSVLDNPQALAQLEVTAEGKPQLDVKGRLQRWALAQTGELPEYRLASMTGPDHAKAFTYEVWVGGRRLGWGTGSRKQEATKAAAQAALELLG